MSDTSYADRARQEAAQDSKHNRSSFILCAVLAVVVIAAVTLVVSRRPADVDPGVAAQGALYAQIVRFCGDSTGPELAAVNEAGSAQPPAAQASLVFCDPSPLDDLEWSAAQLKKLGFDIEVNDELPMTLTDPETGKPSDVARQDAWLITANRPGVTMVVTPAESGLEVSATAAP
jgi:hypothetical protein